MVQLDRSSLPCKRRGSVRQFSTVAVTLAASPPLPST